jgi:hypothetical protein
VGLVDDEDGGGRVGGEEAKGGEDGGYCGEVRLVGAVGEVGWG